MTLWNDSHHYFTFT